MLYGYDRNSYYYDVNGRLVPELASSLSGAKRATRRPRTSERRRIQAGNTYTYELPFVTLDREADMRQAYAHFEKILAERS